MPREGFSSHSFLRKLRALAASLERCTLRAAARVLSTFHRTTDAPAAANGGGLCQGVKGGRGGSEGEVGGKSEKGKEGCWEE